MKRDSQGPAIRSCYEEMLIHYTNFFAVKKPSIGANEENLKESKNISPEKHTRPFLILSFKSDKGTTGTIL